MAEQAAVDRTTTELGIELCDLRAAISAEYAEVATRPDQGYHFHTGRTLTEILGYGDELLAGVPETAIESFAGTGNPFRLGPLAAGERVVDVGCGAGMDSFVAAKAVGPSGRVIGVDMTSEMLEKAADAAEEHGFDNVRFLSGYAEDLPVDDGWADVVISNGVLNLTPDKLATLREWHRVLGPGGRLQIADILVAREVPLSAKRRIDLWTG